jgi:hypothetical protein
MDHQDSVVAMAGWFLQNFEVPGIMYPSAADWPIYVHEDEEPTTPRDELELKFGDQATEEAIAEAVAFITRGGRDEWSASQSRVRLADFDDHVDEQLDLEEQAIERGLDELEEIVAAWREARPPLGHNAPPEEALETDWPSDEELDEIHNGILVIRRNLRSPDRSLWAVNEAAKLFLEYAKKLLRLADTKVRAVIRFSAEAAAAAGVAEAVFHPADFAEKLTAVGTMVQSWLRSVGF